MTLPTSGTITTDDIRRELGKPDDYVVEIPSADTRKLANKPTGNLTLPDDFYGKSNATLMVVGLGQDTSQGLSFAGYKASPPPPLVDDGYGDFSGEVIGSLPQIFDVQHDITGTPHYLWVLTWSGDDVPQDWNIPSREAFACQLFKANGDGVASIHFDVVTVRGSPATFVRCEKQASKSDYDKMVALDGETLTVVTTVT